MLAAPLLAGYDLTSASPESIATLGNPEVIAVDQDRRGRQGRRVRSKRGVETWVRPLADGSQAVLFLNRSGDLRRASFRVDRIPGVKARARYSVRDLWAHTTREVVASELQKVDLRVHEAVMWRVGRARE
jgi:alpha-galactosidase